MRELGPRQWWAPLIAAATAIAIGGATTSQAAFPGHNGRIAFVSDRNNNGLQIFSIRPSGRGIRELADGTGPAYAPSGTWIAFNHRGVSIVRADGTHRRRVVRRGHDPSFSPRGRRVAFWRPKGSGTQICSARLDGSDVKVLVPARSSGGGTVENLDPIYSPTGGRIVFVRKRHRVFHLFSVRRDGSDMKRLRGTRNVFSPDFSPDGMHLVFVRGGASRMEIYSLRLRDSRIRRLTHNHVPDAEPAYAPSGRRIVFSRNLKLVSIRTDGSGKRLIDKVHANGDFEPSWGVRPVD